MIMFTNAHDHTVVSVCGNPGHPLSDMDMVQAVAHKSMYKHSKKFK